MAGVVTEFKKVYSPQELRLQEKSSFGGKRAERLLEGFQGSRPVIDIERGRYFTESFQETEGQPLILRWAKALYHYAEHATVYVDDGQLIAGRAGREGRYGILYPELDGDFLDEAIKSLPERESSLFDISEEDAAYIIEKISPYWKGKTYHEALAAGPDQIAAIEVESITGANGVIITVQSSSLQMRQRHLSIFWISWRSKMPRWQISRDC